MKSVYTTITISFLLLLCVKLGTCGECCKAHYDILLNENAEKWCPKYCCIQLGKYDCCDNVILQAPASEREDFCLAWFSDHSWLPIIVSIGFLLLIVGCVVCCCRMCRSRTPGTVVLQGQQAPVVLQTTSTTMTPNNPYNVGYNQ